MRIFASHQCADYVRASYAGAGEARVACFTFAIVSHSQTHTKSGRFWLHKTMFAVGKAVQVSIQAAMALPRHRPRPPS